MPRRKPKTTAIGGRRHPKRPETTVEGKQEQAPQASQPAAVQSVDQPTTPALAEDTERFDTLVQIWDTHRPRTPTGSPDREEVDWELPEPLVISPIVSSSTSKSGKGRKSSQSTSKSTPKSTPTSTPKSTPTTTASSTKSPKSTMFQSLLTDLGVEELAIEPLTPAEEFQDIQEETMEVS